MKILHIASFCGNIGDNISHKGLLNLLCQTGFKFNIEKLEIRRFYNNYKYNDKLSFDEDMIKYINKFDYCIIGGGGFSSL